MWPLGLPEIYLDNYHLDTRNTCLGTMNYVLITPFLCPPFVSSFSVAQVECAVHNPEPHVNTESTADTPVVGHGCVWVRHFVLRAKKEPEP